MPDSPNGVGRRPVGHAIRRNDAARERVAAVTAADVLNARLLWMRHAPPGWQGLIEARKADNPPGGPAT